MDQCIDIFDEFREVQWRKILDEYKNLKNIKKSEETEMNPFLLNS